MKRVVQSLFIILIMASSIAISAQKIEVLKGDWMELKGEKTLLVEFNYEKAGVGKYSREATYVKEKVNKKNKDEAGTGDAWSEAWYGDREARYQPKFIELFNKQSEAVGGFTISEDATDAKYKMVVHTLKLEPGFNIGISRKSASVNVRIEIIKIGEEVATTKAKMTEVPGVGAMGFDFDTGLRLQECYAKTGKMLGNLLGEDAYTEKYQAKLVKAKAKARKKKKKK